MIRELLRYPFAGSPRVDAVLVGGGLHLIAVWLPLLPFVVVAGYGARVLAATADVDRVRDADRPGWRPVRPLLADGLRMVVTAVGYLAVPVILLVVTFGGPLERVDPTGTTDGTVFLLGTTLTTMLAFAVAYPLPAALVAVARERSLRAAVDTSLVGPATRDAGYLVAVLLSTPALALAAGAYGALNVVALGFFVAFYVEVVVAAVLGNATGRAWRRRGIVDGERYG
ncbi:hypothetical protein J2751_000770 [Halorubrum alkaliphilum]|uniref:DUF4013 domain-containing protein n=1 Tax=Halorubrum alkaliphilum TaxID=261290 RepID=A0A8T4GCE4_9EURY|nr:DUF4013 domain-containing protein [Halorubrum alkaliphilum]MBP1921773.1 hypothetical protein [Halorubrum alkaliphilum]